MKKKISKGTILRTAALLLAIANNVLTLAGKSPLPIENETVTDVIGFLFTTAASLTAWWKNNSFSQPAIKADERLRELRADERLVIR